MNAINQTQLYGKVTRNQLFYSPALFQSQLNLEGLIFPEYLFEVNKHRMDEIINIRQQNLQKAGTPPAAEIRVGNIVSNYHLPFSSSTTGHSGSREISPLVKSIYRVTEVNNLQLRLVNIITGAARTLPTQHVRKLKITDLAKIKFETRSEYLSSRLRRLYSKNKYLPPKESRKWANILQNMDQKDDINPPEEPRPDDTEQEEDSEEEDESTEKEEGEDEEHQTRTTRSGKAYNVEFHPSYFAMMWDGPHQDLTTTDQSTTQKQSVQNLSATQPTFSPSLLKKTRQRTLSEQLLCLTQESRKAYIRAQPSKYIKVHPDQVTDMRKVKEHQVNESKFEWRREKKSHNKKVSFNSQTHCDHQYNENLKCEPEPRTGHTLRVSFLDLDMSIAELLL